MRKNLLQNGTVKLLLVTKYFKHSVENTNVSLAITALLTLLDDVLR